MKNFIYLFAGIFLFLNCSKSSGGNSSEPPSLPSAQKVNYTNAKKKVDKSAEPEMAKGLQEKIKNVLPKGYKFYKSNQAESVYVIEYFKKMPTSQDMRTFGSGSRPLVENVKPYIMIKVFERVDPAQIGKLRKKAKKLRKSLPPPKSKRNLAKWSQENKAALKFIRSVPTYYDKDGSYKIKHSYMPDDKTQRKIFKTLLTKVKAFFVTYS